MRNFWTGSIVLFSEPSGTVSRVDPPQRSVIAYREAPFLLKAEVTPNHVARSWGDSKGKALRPESSRRKDTGGCPARSAFVKKRGGEDAASNRAGNGNALKRTNRRSDGKKQQRTEGSLLLFCFSPLLKVAGSQAALLQIPLMVLFGAVERLRRFQRGRNRATQTPTCIQRGNHRFRCRFLLR